MHPTASAHSPLEMIKGLLRLMRPRQWVKNAFVFAPLLFSGEFTSLDAIANSIVAALIFCLASAVAYIVNDIRDIEKDRLHPKKAFTRPLASGVVSVRLAVVQVVALYALLGSAWLYWPEVVYVALCYIVLNLAYSFVLKHQPVLDIFTIALGFVLRVYAGAVALDVPLSSWMFVTTLCLALYLAAIKRRQEMLSHGDQSRKVLQQYSPELINRYAEMSAIGAILFYSLFVMNARPELVTTIPLVLYGIFRYWFIVDSNNVGESPTDALLGDWQLQLTIAVWIAASLYAMWPQV